MPNIRPPGQKLESALKDLKDLRFALDQSTEVAITDSRGRIVYVNDGFCRISKYSKEELLGQNHRLLNSRTHPKEFFKDMWDTISNGRVWHGDICNKAKDGTLHWMATTITPFLGADGRPAQYVCIRHDITRIKHAELELAKARDLALEAARIKADFMANMSHEIRTPLNGVIGMTDLLQTTQITAEQRDYVETIRKSSDILLTLINDILDFSKIESGRLELEEIDFSLKIMVEDAAAIFASEARQKGLELLCRMDPGLPPVVRGDPARLKQVLLNLIGNAVKFTDRGRVEVRVTPAEGNGRSRPVRFEIQDTGIGIAPKLQARLFEAFRQGDSSVTRRYGGTGLGLVISKRLVQRMGGEIRLRSEQGAGSTFSFTVPFAPGEKSPDAGPRAKGAVLRPSSSGRVLIAEDNLVNQKVLLCMARKLGYEAAVVANGRDAMAALEKSRYDAVVMDCEMPELDGYAAARAIRAKGGRRTPIIALTAHALPGDREKALASGMDDYLAKPVRMEDLESTLAQWILRTQPQPRAAPGDAQVPMDESVLKKLGALDEEAGPDVLAGILRTFLVETQKQLEQLSQGLRDQDGEKVRRGAHLLHGGSLTLGATHLGKLCRKLEEDARAGRLDVAARDLSETQDEFGKVRAYLERRLAGDGGTEAHDGEDTHR